MKFWDDQLRFCPKCKAAVRMASEDAAECPKCRARVRFYHYRSIPRPPEVPEAAPGRLWDDPKTTALLIATGLVALLALIAIHNRLFVAVACALVALGFAAFAVLRHAEAHRLEQHVAHQREVLHYADVMKNRFQDAVSRHNHLLRTGDARVEQYFRQVYLQAEREREQAEGLRWAAAADREAVRTVEERIYAMAKRLIDDHLNWSAKKLRADPDNYQRRRNELDKAFGFVESVGYRLPAKLRSDSLADLKERYRRVVHEQALKDEQKRIRQQMREEERLRKEQEQAIKEAEERERELQRRLREALSHQRDEYDAEVEALQQQLAEAHAGTERAKSMAQLTKAGHVYILSNVGSFGEDVFKVGMTRRLEPLDRVKELGDASVPFPFDVHAMIGCENAPSLENALHRELARHRVNRVNLRKEFFQVSLDVILEAVRKHHGVIEYVAEAEALDYRETQGIDPEDLVELEAELAEIGVSFDDEDQ